MEPHTLVISFIAAITALLGIFGWSHKSLRQRITDMEMQSLKNPTFSDVRLIMSDKIAPIQVEYNSIIKTMDELKSENHKLNDKMDRLLVICTKLTHEK